MKNFYVNNTAIAYVKQNLLKDYKTNRNKLIVY